MAWPLEPSHVPSHVARLCLDGDPRGTSSGNEEISGVRRKVPSEITVVVTSEDEGRNNDDWSLFSTPINKKEASAKRVGKKEIRGRPPTTGEYVGLREKREKLLYLKKQEISMRDEEILLAHAERSLKELSASPESPVFIENRSTRNLPTIGEVR